MEQAKRQRCSCCLLIAPPSGKNGSETHSTCFSAFSPCFLLNSTKRKLGTSLLYGQFPRPSAARARGRNWKELKISFCKPMMEERDGASFQASISLALQGSAVVCSVDFDFRKTINPQTPTLRQHSAPSQ